MTKSIRKRRKRIKCTRTKRKRTKRKRTLKKRKRKRTRKKTFKKQSGGEACAENEPCEYSIQCIEKCDNKTNCYRPSKSANGVCTKPNMLSEKLPLDLEHKIRNQKMNKQDTIAMRLVNIRSKNLTPFKIKKIAARQLVANDMWYKQIETYGRSNMHRPHHTEMVAGMTHDDWEYIIQMVGNACNVQNKQPVAFPVILKEINLQNWNITETRFIQLVNLIKGCPKITILNLNGSLRNVSFNVINEQVSQLVQLTELSIGDNWSYQRLENNAKNNNIRITYQHDMTMNAGWHGTAGLGSWSMEMHSLAALVNLTKLDLRGNGITSTKGIGVHRNLTELNLSRNRIKSTVGLGGLFNLTCIDLKANEITSTDELSELVKLTDLNLHMNNLTQTSVAKLGGLVDLTELSLSRNQIVSVEELGGLVNLTHLDLDEDVVDPHRIVNRNKLRQLTKASKEKTPFTIDLESDLTDQGHPGFYQPQEWDIIMGVVENACNNQNNQPAGSPAILKEINLQNWNLTKDNFLQLINLLKGCPKITILNLNGSLSDIYFEEVIVEVAKLVQLTELSICGKYFDNIENWERLPYIDEEGNRSTDYEHINGTYALAAENVIEIARLQDRYYYSQLTLLNSLTNLTHLDLHGRQITSIEGLSGMVNLTRLDLNDNQITSIEGLSGLVGLTELGLGDNQITSIEGLSGLVRLTTLELNGNQITSIEGLSGLVDLTELYLYGNQITSIEELSGLVGLTQLNLGANQITSIEGLSGLVGLTELDVNHNQITSIEGLSGLVGLTELYLGENQITSIEGLSGLVGLTELHIDEGQITSIEGLGGGVNITWHDDGREESRALGGW